MKFRASSYFIPILILLIGTTQASNIIRGNSIKENSSARALLREQPALSLPLPNKAKNTANSTAKVTSGSDEEFGDLLSDDETDTSASSDDETDISASSDDETDTSSDQSDDDSTFIDKIFKNLKVNLGITGIHFGKQIRVEELTSGLAGVVVRAFRNLTGIPQSTYALDIHMKTHAKLTESMRFKTDLFLDLTNIDSGLKNAFPLGNSVSPKLTDPRYFVGVKELYIEKNGENTDWYFGKRILNSTNTPTFYCLTCVYNPTIFSTFMPIKSGPWQLSLENSLNDNNSITFALLPFPNMMNLTAQIFNWGDEWITSANTFDRLFPNLRGAVTTYNIQKYNAKPKQWSYYFDWKNTSGDFTNFLTLFYGEGKNWIVTNITSDLADVIRPKVWQISSTNSWDKGNWQLYSQLLMSYSVDKNDDSYITGGLGADYNASWLADKLDLALLKITVQYNHEKIIDHPKNEFWNLVRTDASDPLANADHIGSYLFRSMNRSFGTTITIGYSQKLFILTNILASVDKLGNKLGGKSSGHISTSITTGFRYQKSDNTSITAFFNKSDLQSLIGSNYAVGLSLNRQL